MPQKFTPRVIGPVQVTRDALDKDRRRVPVDPFGNLSVVTTASGRVVTAQLTEDDLVDLIASASDALVTMRKIARDRAQKQAGL